MMDFSYSDIERSFIEAMESCGISPATGEQLKMDGSKHRIKLTGDKGRATSGEYCIYLDESPAGWFKSYRASHGVPYEAWSYKSEVFSSMSPAERRAFIEKKEAERAERERIDAMERQRAIQISREKWAHSTPAIPMHNYALKKCLRDLYGARLLGNDLVIPYTNTNYEIMIVQTISMSGQKYFQTNGPKMGNFCVLSGEAEPSSGVNVIPANTNGPVFVCEGWATGCSIRAATESVVIVAADAGNLMHVVGPLRESRPDLELVVAADNDKYKRNGNAGMAAAIKIFEQTGIPYVAPDFNDSEELSDWNDFSNARGMEATRRSIEQKLEIIKSSAVYEELSEIPQFVHTNSKTGKPKGTIANLEILMNSKKIWVGYNEIKKEEILKIPGKVYCGDNAMTAAVAAIVSLCVEYGLPKGDIDLFLTEIASRHIVNPVKDWILSVPWDGTSRIKKICSSIAAEKGFPEDLKNILIRRWLVSGVAAAFSRGEFHCRGVLVFQGAQGIGKSTWFKTLAGSLEWFGDGLSVNASNKDDVMPAIRRWIVELGELEGTFKKSEISKLKTFLAAATDYIRVPYGRRVSAFQRRTIFCGTVNQREFLMDATGNSRFWCVPVVSIERLDPADVQQIWAEVYSQYYLSADE